jgi:hypothetical protein
MSIKDKLAKLIDVKTIVTFSVVGTIVYLSVTGKLEPTKMYELGMIIVTFFFVKKADENK